MVGTVWSASVAGPVIQVTVPSAIRPASFSISGPSAATTTGGAATPSMASGALVDIVSPVNAAGSPWRSGTRIDRYSRMCRAGFSNDMPNIDSMTIWCDRPMPRSSRPSHAIWVVSACAASINGCRG